MTSGEACHTKLLQHAAFGIAMGFVALVATDRAIAATFSPGSGGSTPAIQASFINAYNRGPFSRFVVAPSGDVKALGSPGLVQEFPSRTDSSVYALIKPDPTVPTSGLDTLQVYGDIYRSYLGIGVSIAGYPTIDTTACFSAAMGPCDYQLFTKDYALFAYAAGPMTVTVKDPFFTEWTVGGGMATYGPANGTESSITSISGIVATQQLFNGGVIFSYTSSGSTAATTIGLLEPFNTAFANSSGYLRIGLPTSEPVTVNAGGLVRQTFENGRIELFPGGTPTVIFNISLIGIAGQLQPLTLVQGASATLMASVFDTTNQAVTGRSLSWSTSNGSVARIVGQGDTATLQAVGPGEANIYISGEGRTGGPLIVRVGSGCCSVGQGAPSVTITQSFQAAIVRNQLTNITSVAVTRLGNGYIQALSGTNGTTLPPVVSQADSSSIAYVISGSLEAAYVAAGGFTGSLGYPASDPLPGGAQKFTSGAALGGTPVRTVPAVIASKWFQLGGATGSVGSPSGDASVSLSATGVSVVAQAFATGTIYGVVSGSRAGQAFFSSGQILSRYVQLGGPGGSFGLPVNDVASSSGVQIEGFEGGYIDLQPGTMNAVEHPSARHPAVTVSRSTVAPGGRIHIAASGFQAGVTLAFTITGQAGFTVQASPGYFAYDYVVPGDAKPGFFTIQVRAQGGSDAAQAVYSITSVTASLPRFVLISGDKQSGVPGSVLRSPIIGSLQDASGNPLPGVPVSFSGSAGLTAQAVLVTDQNGIVILKVRLPAVSGVAVGSIFAASQVVNFSALAVANSIQNVPVFVQSNSQESFTTAMASLLAFYQNIGSLPAPNGPSTPQALHQFIASKGGFVLLGTPDPIPNPWVLAQFASASISVDVPTLDRVRDLINVGTPVAVLLNVSVDGALYDGNTVDAVGVATDGSIVIDDPNSLFARESLQDYLNGFSTHGHQVTAIIAALIEVGPGQSVAALHPFTVTSPLAAGVSASSPAGACQTLDLLSSAGTTTQRFQYCDGSQAAYEADFATQAGAALTDLTSGNVQQIAPNSGPSFNISSKAGNVVAVAQTISISGTTDSAAYRPAIAPGELFTIFGSGLSADDTVTLNGAKIPVLAAFPFQINAEVPASYAVGPANLQVSGASGAAFASIEIVQNAPAIFQMGQQGAIVNQSGLLNSADAPAQRGQFISIYCTGLGTTTVKAGLAYVDSATVAVLNGVTVQPSFAGLAPGFLGLYQVNLTVPDNLPPLGAGSLLLQQRGQTSNAVGFSVQ